MRGIYTQMKTTLKGTQLHITPSLETYVYERLIHGIERRLAAHPKKDAITIDIELAREGMHHKKGNVFRAEVNILMPSRRLIRIEESAEDIRAAIDSIEKRLMKELDAQKGKTVLAARRQQRRAKQKRYEE